MSSRVAPERGAEKESGKPDALPTPLGTYEEITPVLTMLQKMGIKKYAVVSNTFLMMEHTIGSKEARDRCKSTWTTMGVVSALLASVSLAPIFGAVTVAGPDEAVDVWDAPLLRGLLYTSVLAFICNIVVILMSVMFYVYVDHCFAKDAVGRFIHDWIGPIMSLPIIFAVSCTLIVVIVLLCVAYTTDMNVHFVVLASVVSVLGAYLIYLATAMGIYVGRECAHECLEGAAKPKASEGGRSPEPAAEDKGQGQRVRAKPRVSE